MALRSTESPDAGYTILKTVTPQTGNVIVDDLHLSTSECRALVQLELVFSAILQRTNRHMDA